MYSPDFQHRVGCKLGQRHSLVPDFAVTPVAMGENESDTPILMEIYPKGVCVCGSPFPRFLVRYVKTGPTPPLGCIFTRIGVFDTLSSIGAVGKEKLCANKCCLPDLHLTLWWKSAKYSIFIYTVEVHFVCFFCSLDSCTLDLSERAWKISFDKI